MKSYRNSFDERRVELLKEHYDFNEETKVFDIALHYQKTSDLFVESFDLNKKKMMKSEIVEQIGDLLNDIPTGYKAEFSIVIDDYEGISHQEILDAFNNALKFRATRFKVDNKRKYQKVGILILTGLFFIALMILGEILSWWSSEGSANSRLIAYLLDTLGCVLIWEGLYSALVERTEAVALGYRLSTRIKSIGLYRNDNSEQALISEGGDVIFSINRDKRGKVVGSMFLFVSGFALVGSGILNFMFTLPTLISGLSVTNNNVVLVLMFVLQVIFSISLVGLGFLAIEVFNENYRHFILIAVFSSLMLVFLIIFTTLLFIAGPSAQEVVTASISIAVMILYIVGFALTAYHRKEDISKAVKKR